ncbi:hypothetical protein BHE74_00027871 [Ensete ventricosum]|nr:hypothetical protein GW17_00036316 [Ensete ventricosum]RWW64864.1 hypothetical protein BHE74_00027871 [Ensete ventricosum]RZS00314.1 hypothetical protein BHM03_00029984 [Ensete ventricosum]
MNPAPIAAQPPSFLALESVPRLGEKSRCPSTPEITDSMLGITDPRSDRRPSTLEFARNDRRGEIAKGSNRPPLPALR